MGRNLDLRIAAFSNTMRFVFIAKAEAKFYLEATYSPKVFLAGPKYGQEGSGKQWSPG